MIKSIYRVRGIINLFSIIILVSAFAIAWGYGSLAIAFSMFLFVLAACLEIRVFISSALMEDESKP